MHSVGERGHNSDDQQDGHACEREGAHALWRHHLALSSPMTVSHGVVLASVPALCERSHRSLARGLIAVGRSPDIAVWPLAQRGRSRRGLSIHDKTLSR